MNDKRSNLRTLQSYNLNILIHHQPIFNQRDSVMLSQKCLQAPYSSSRFSLAAQTTFFSLTFGPGKKARSGQMVSNDW